MGLFNTLNTGITGLGANGLALGVIADNMANLNTVGFKGSQTQFQDLIVQNLGSGRGQLGLGTFTGRVKQYFQQGALENAPNATDIAIDGRGLFVLRGAEGMEFYSRNGQFSVDQDGFIVTNTGLHLQGYQADANGNILTTTDDLQVPLDPISGTATTNLAVTANLDARETAVGVPPVGPGLTFAQISAAAQYTSSAVVYDSLGAAHDVTLGFYRTGVNTWDFRAYVDAGEVGGVPGEATDLLPGGSTITFLTDGTIDLALSPVASSVVTFTGAAAQTIEWDFGNPAAAPEGNLTQFATDNAVHELDPDGNGAGEVVGFEINEQGVLTVIYSNGEKRNAGQLTLALFRGEEFLRRAGHNLWEQTTESGQPTFGEPGSAGRGLSQAYALEMSNVDIEQQFVKMIQVQKGYQASAKMVSAANDLLQDLMQMV